MLIEYVKLYQQGDETLEARKNLLMETKNEVQKQLDKYQATMDRLNFKISRYEEAVKTGILSWKTDKEG
jgi:DNA-binding transcriptional MerR regulator